MGWNGHFIRVAVQFRHMHPQKSEYKVLGLSYTYRRRYNQKGPKNRESGAILMLAKIGQNSFLSTPRHFFKKKLLQNNELNFIGSRSSTIDPLHIISITLDMTLQNSIL